MILGLIKATLLVPFILAGPTPYIQWADLEQGAIKMWVQGEDPLLKKCVESGLGMRYRFKVQLCRQRAGWFARCSKVRNVIHILKFDPISENYTLAKDLLGDPENPTVLGDISLEEALSQLRKVERFDLSNIAKEVEVELNSRNAYLSLRIVSECRGEYNQTVADLSYLLSLGTVRLDGFDTGWLDFNLSQP